MQRERRVIVHLLHKRVYVLPKYLQTSPETATAAGER
jgi:hypothetical protein